MKKSEHRFQNHSKMKYCSSLILQPVCFLVLLVLSALIASKLYVMTKQVEHSAISQLVEVHNKSFADIETIARLLLPLNSSASHLARALSSSVDETELSFKTIQAKVAPTLFMALSTIPLVSQVSYIGSNGLLFSFYNDDGQTQAVYSDTSFSSKWYSQPVNRDTGKPYGEAATSISMAYTRSLHEALNQKFVHYSLGMSWNNPQDLLFLTTAAMDGRGVISIGFLAEWVIDRFQGLDLHGGDFYLATNDGQVLVQSKLPNTKIVVNNGTVALQLLKPNGDSDDIVNNYLCNAKNGDSGYHRVNIREINHVFYCSSLEIVGVPSVYILAFPTNDTEAAVHRNANLAITFFLLMLVIGVVSLCFYTFMTIRSARREMFLCSTLIKQMESTQQAERKSMKKSLAFARTSHDMRGLLESTSDLVEHCQRDVIPNSGLATKLKQMHTCVVDLLNMLNSVLDSSKIEAGKVQLEEEEFNLAQFLEDIVDIFYTTGMKKGVDVVLDSCDGSILKLHLVKGDRRRLKQILCNLLHNAVKFTSEGHVSIRAVVKKTGRKEKAIMASARNSVFSYFLALLCRNHGTFRDLDDIHTVQQDPNSMEFIFEVDDTGKGIPKDQRNSVFENFIQVSGTALDKETLGLGGCGLGLGIVQSLVRLMGGEISIVDKEPGEKGTCFRFNIFLATRDPPLTSDNDEQEFYMLSDGPASGSHQHFGLYNRSPASRTEGSLVLLLIAGEERRKVSKKFMEHLGIRVSIVKRARDIYPFVESINSSCHSSPGGPNEGSASVKDGQDNLAPHYKRSGSKRSFNFVLIVIDSRFADSVELSSVVGNLRRDVQNSRCKFVWIDSPIARNYLGTELEAKHTFLPPHGDHIFSEPFHGSRLYRALELLPEFGGTYRCDLPVLNIKRAQAMQHSQNPGTSVSELTSVPHEKHQVQEKTEIQECDQSSDEKPLNGKKVLVVEDVPVLRMLAATRLSKLGAKVDVCENGEQAFNQVRKGLRGQRDEGNSRMLPYDYIFMDCQMPVKDGFEATRLIREEEKQYGIRIPIFALTASAMTEEGSKSKDAGMDFHLTKPLKTEQLLDAITSLQNADHRHS